MENFQCLLSPSVKLEAVSRDSEYILHPIH